MRVRVSPAEKARIEAAALAAERSVSDWCRVTLLGSVGGLDRRGGVVVVDPPAAVVAGASVPPRLSSPPVSDQGERSARAGSKPLFAKAGCLMKVAEGERCSSCGAVHKP